MSRPRLLVLAHEPRARLRAGAALREQVEVLVPEDPSERVLRTVRRLRPDGVLLALTRGRLSPGLSTCRLIKTDQGQPPVVGLTDAWSRLRHPDAALTGCHGDGYLGGVPDEAGLRAFVQELLTGRRPVHLHPPAGGVLSRVVGRISRS